jgi:hypothetical protein
MVASNSKAELDSQNWLWLPWNIALFHFCDIPNYDYIINLNLQHKRPISI